MWKRQILCTSRNPSNTTSWNSVSLCLECCPSHCLSYSEVALLWKNPEGTAFSLWLILGPFALESGQVKWWGDKKADVFWPPKKQLAETLAHTVGDKKTEGEKHLEWAGLSRFTKTDIILHSAFVNSFMLHALSVHNQVVSVLVSWTNQKHLCYSLSDFMSISGLPLPG